MFSIFSLLAQHQLLPLFAGTAGALQMKHVADVILQDIAASFVSIRTGSFITRFVVSLQLKVLLDIHWPHGDSLMKQKVII